MGSSLKIRWLEKTYYGHEYNYHDSKETFFTHITPRKSITKLYSEDKEILSLRLGIIEDEVEDDDSAYWGWKRKGEEGISMIYPWKGAFEMCFPYGPKIEEEHGKGKIVRLKIERVRDE